jgi:hypothetical protein
MQSANGRLHLHLVQLEFRLRQKASRQSTAGTATPQGMCHRIATLSGNSPFLPHQDDDTLYARYKRTLASCQ